jgi:hypothetical protein
MSEEQLLWLPLTYSAGIDGSQFIQWQIDETPTTSGYGHCPLYSRRNDAIKFPILCCSDSLGTGSTEVANSGKKGIKRHLVSRRHSIANLSGAKSRPASFEATVSLRHQ